MEKMELTRSGKCFLQNLRACLNWLAIGGEIKLKSLHTLMMDQLGRPGFLVTSYDTKTKESTLMLIQLGSETAWGALIEHAQEMSDEDFIRMSSNVVLNETTI